MSDDLKSFEDALKELQPKPLSPEAQTRLENSLTKDFSLRPREVASSSSGRTIKLVLALAASVIFVCVASVMLSKDTAPGSQPGPIADVSKPAPADAFHLEEQITAVHDEGIVVDSSDQAPARLIRKEYVTELTITDPVTGKTYTIHEPQSETIVVALEQF